MKYGVLFAVSLLLAACGPSDSEIDSIATSTCQILDYTSESDSVMRIKEVNDARDSLGLERFAGGDSEILQAMWWGACKELISDNRYELKIEEKKNLGKRWFKEKFEVEKITVKGSANSTRGSGVIKIKHSCFPDFIRLAVLESQASINFAALNYEITLANEPEPDGGCSTSYVTNDWVKSVKLQAAERELGSNVDVTAYTSYQFRYLDQLRQQAAIQEVP